MLFFITPPRKALKPNSPPNNTPTATNMMIMRLVMNATPHDSSFSVCGLRGKGALPLALPPAAAQRLEERRGVRVARSLRLNKTDLGLLVLPLRVEERELARRAELELLGRHVEAFARRGLGLGLRLERDRVELQGEQHVGDVLERAEDGLLILREGLVVGGLCAALPRLELSGVKNRLKQAGADIPDLRARIENAAFGGCRGAVASAQSQLRKHERLRDADARVGLMRNGFRRADVGPLAHEIRGQADRKVLRQLERREIELGQARLARKLADEDRKLIACLRERFLERRQVRARLRKLRALREHVRARNGAELELLLDQLQLALLRIDDIARRADLLAQRRLAERGGRDVRRQRKIGGLELKALEVYARAQRLELAPRAARHVDGVGHVDRGVVQIEDAAGDRRIAERRARNALALRRQTRVDARIEHRVLGVQVLLGLAKCSLRRGERRMAGEGRAHQLVEFRRAEKRPPLGGDLRPHLEALRLSTAHRRRFGLFGLRFFGVELDRRSIRCAIVRTDRATRQEGGGRDRHPSAERNEFVHLFSLERLVPFLGSSPTTRARTASRNWRCALASPAEPLWKKWSHSAVLKRAAIIRPATVSGSAAGATLPSCCSARR